MCIVTKTDETRNEHVRGSVKVEPIKEVRIKRLKSGMDMLRERTKGTC